MSSHLFINFKIQTMQFLNLVLSLVNLSFSLNQFNFTMTLSIYLRFKLDLIFF